MEAPDGTSEDFKDAAIERGNAILIDFDVEQVLSVERIRARARYAAVARDVKLGLAIVGTATRSLDL